MKKRIYIFLSLVFILLFSDTNAAPGRDTQVENLIQRRQSLVASVDTSRLTEDQVLLVMDFNSPVILNPAVFRSFKDRPVLKAELIYTAYRLSQTFSQPGLNRLRLENLEKLLPGILSDSSVKWDFLAQTAGQTEEEARKMFHGFRITFGKKPGEPKRGGPEREIGYLLDMLNSDSLGTDTLVLLPVPHVKKKRVVTDSYLPRLDFKRKLGIVHKRRGIWNRPRLVVTKYDTIVKEELVSRFNISKDARKYISQIHDSAVLSVLNRNPHWNNILFICDVTGSMSPYSAQLLIWNKLNFNKRRGRYFTFFNDGDNMPDYKKIIGQTGGIYHTEAQRLKDIEETAILAMRNGWGGDTPENYIEALSDAIRRFPSASEIVLVADNWAPVKDMELLYRIKKPVHIILCGTGSSSINIDYVRLAFKTKGSVHTIEQDINKLAQLKEGDTVRIGQQTFQLMKGKIRLAPL